MRLCSAALLTLKVVADMVRPWLPVMVLALWTLRLVASQLVRWILLKCYPCLASPSDCCAPILEATLSLVYMFDALE
jgi:hypothetical protein